MNLVLRQTGACIRMRDEETGFPYWQTTNESSKDTEPPMRIDEPLLMMPEDFQLGTAIAVMEPDSPVDPRDADAHGLVGDAPPRQSEWINVRREGDSVIVEHTYQGQTREIGRTPIDCPFSDGWNLTLARRDRAEAPTTKG